MTTVKFNTGDEVRIKTRTEIYNKLLVTIDEISEEKGMGLVSWPGGEEWMFLDDLEIVNTAESGVFGWFYHGGRGKLKSPLVKEGSDKHRVDNPLLGLELYVLNPNVYPEEYDLIFSKYHLVIVFLWILFRKKALLQGSNRAAIGLSALLVFWLRSGN